MAAAAGGGSGGGDLLGGAEARAKAYRRVRAAFAYFDGDGDEGEENAQRPAFMENAGGSQVPRCVADAVRDHLLYDCAQLGAGHPVSLRSTATVERAHATVDAFVGAGGAGRSALGASASQLLATLGWCYSRLLRPGDEIVVHDACHEANAGPWVRCAQQTGATLRWWKVDVSPSFGPAPASDGGGANGGLLPVSFPCASRVLGGGLERLLSPATRVVAVAHVSNLLGGVVDVGAVVAAVRRLAPRARIVVDGVAYAPHRLVSVAEWGVDFYAFSVYKTWGPHLAALYGRHDAWRELVDGCRASAAAAEPGPPWPVSSGPNHYFCCGDKEQEQDEEDKEGGATAAAADATDPLYWFELGGASHEACAGTVAVGQYLRLLASQGAARGAARGEPEGAAAEDGAGARGAAGRPPLSRADVEAAFAVAEALEAPLAGPILDAIRSCPDLILIGPPSSEKEDGQEGGQEGGQQEEDDGWRGRVPTISFVHRTKPSSQVSASLQSRGFAVRHGHMYARRMMEALSPSLAPFLHRDDEGDDDDDDEEGARRRLDKIVEDGVVRVSLLHYNTLGEVAALVDALRDVCR